MATFNGVKPLFHGNNPKIEDCVTQSLEHIVLNALRKKAKQVNKGVEESVLPPMASSHTPFPAALPELHARLGKWRESARVNQPILAETHNEVTQSINPEGTEPPLAGVALKRKVITAPDLLVSRAGEKVTATVGLPGAESMITAQERRDMYLSTATPSQIMASNSLLPDSASAETVSLRAEKEYSPYGIPLANGELSRVVVGDHTPRRNGTESSAAARQSPQAEAMLRSMSTVTLNEASPESQLLYRFSDWGDGHQVNVQLGGHAKVPHVLHVSDPLVHQRLADYEGQGQGDPEWVFSDEEEHPKKEQIPLADEESV